MSKVCNHCEDKKIEAAVPYIVHESAMARSERQIKRMWIALIAAISMLFVSNAAWLVYESQFETFYYDKMVKASIMSILVNKET